MRLRKPSFMSKDMSLPSLCHQLGRTSELSLFATTAAHISYGRLHERTSVLALKQGLVLSGLGIESFDNAVQGTKLIHQSFVSHLREEKVKDWELRKDGDNLILAFHNRLLTPYKDLRGEEVLDMSAVDPLKVLQGRLTSEVYTSDNQVEYWQTHSQSNNKRFDQGHISCTTFLTYLQF